MSDRRIVHCFGIRRRPHKEAKVCKKGDYLWTASGISGNFGSKGVQACPSCGTPPDFSHPYNKYLQGDMTYDEATTLMPEYRKKLGLE